MFIIAKVSNQIQANHIAWSVPVDTADTLEEAQQKANEVWQQMCQEFDLLPQGEGYVMAQGIIIHNGETIY